MSHLTIEMFPVLARQIGVSLLYSDLPCAVGGREEEARTLTLRTQPDGVSFSASS